MKKFNRKGQLTIFIIIGIVLLFSTALIIYIKNAVTEYKPPVSAEMQKVPAALQPLYIYTLDCVKQVSKEAIIKAGMQGGYVDSSGIIVNDADPTSGEGISMSPGSDIKVPYWYYMKSNNVCQTECLFDSKMPERYRKQPPTGNSIEEQIDKYVEMKLSSCTANFARFRDQFTVKEGNIKATTTIAKTDIFVQVKYPLTISFPDGRTEELSQFTAQHSVDFGKFYDLAFELTQKEISTAYLGFFAINLIDVYSGPDKNKLPPLADTTFDFSSKPYWMQNNVKSQLEEIFMMYTPALRATGLSNYEGNLYKGNSKLAQGLYQMMILPLNSTYQANAEFSYLAWWPTYIKITPSSGELIKPESLSGLGGLLSMFGFTQYKFVYDVSYPVLIALSDDKAFDGEGFNFMFALESNIRNNAAMKSDTTLLSYSGRPRQTMVCDEQNFKSAEVEINVSDSMTSKPVDGAVIYFSFGKDSCLVGVAEKGILKSKFPVGAGTLVISKDKYLSKTVPFGTSLDETKKVSAELEPYVKINVSLSRIAFIKNYKQEGFRLISEWLPFATPMAGIDATEQAVVTMRRIPENILQEEFVASFEMRGNETRTKEITIVPGNYEVSASLFDYQTTIIPEDEYCYDTEPLNPFGGKKCEKIPQILFEVFPKGGLVIDSYPISKDSLNGSKELVMYLISIPDGYTRDSSGRTNLIHKDLEEMGNVEKYSSDYYDLLQPKFIK